MSAVPTIDAIDKAIWHLNAVLNGVMLRMNYYGKDAKEAAARGSYSDAAGWQSMVLGLTTAETLLRDEIKLLEQQRRALGQG